MQRNDETATVAGLKLLLEGVNSIGLGLVPLPGNVGRYPVVVIINGETHLPRLIEDGAVYVHHEPIDKAEVSVSLGGGVDGDKWRILKKRTAAEVVEGRYPTDDAGQLIAVPSGERELFDLDSRNNPDPFVAAFSGSLIPDGGATVLYEVTPNNKAAFTWGTSGPTWSVGGFSRVLFGVEAGSPNGPGTVMPIDSIKGWVRGYGRRTSFDTLTLSGCGSVNEFGTDGGVVWNGVPGAVMLGAGVDNGGDDYTTYSPRLMPYARFVMKLSVDAVTAEQLRSGAYWLRCYAVGFYT